MKTLVLDLDETLITSCLQRDGPDKILFPNNDETIPPVIETLENNPNRL